MKQVIAFIAVLLQFGNNLISRNSVMLASTGFDILCSRIPLGNIDTVTYNSKTVANKGKIIDFPDFTK